MSRLRIVFIIWTDGSICGIVVFRVLEDRFVFVSAELSCDVETALNEYRLRV